MYTTTPQTFNMWVLDRVSQEEHKAGDLPDGVALVAHDVRAPIC
jgi:hypothetical protein